MTTDERWLPDNDDGSGRSDVDWASTARGSRYHYRHVLDPESETRPAFYRVVTRIESADLNVPHENSYFIPRANLADFAMELSLSGGDECIWHIEPCPSPPLESRIIR